MHNMINAINWEHVMLVLVSILGAFGASRAWLKKLCAQLNYSDEKTKALIKYQNDLRSMVIKNGLETKELRELLESKEDKK